jgi:hypothetical protein
MIKTLKKKLDELQEYRGLPEEAKALWREDRQGPPAADPGNERCIQEALLWLGRAQDRNKLKDGGAARNYSIATGWSSSYPETSGYIVPTLLDCARIFNDGSLRERARRMLDWLVSIQLPGGGFQGGLVDSKPVVPVTFNTGQILLGLAAGVKDLGESYRAPMNAAAAFLADSLDPDGCWRKHSTPFAEPGEKAYETHVAWGLLEAARLEPSKNYGEQALRNIRWSLTKQKPNGWIADCCLDDPSRPLTHTLGYALRGYLEGYRFSKDKAILAASIKTADGLLSALQGDGFLPGRLLPDWRGAVKWSCLTGEVQIAYCWLMLWRYTGEAKYKEAALKANAYVRRTMKVDGPEDLRGGVKGSFPVYGDYGHNQLLNWACKFAIDAFLFEKAPEQRDV